MAKEVMMLAKNLDLKKIEYPVWVSEKIDGAAARFEASRVSDGTTVFAKSRQNKGYGSVQHICDWLRKYMPTGPLLCGELYVPGLPFKDSGGTIRRMNPEPSIRLGIYDWFDPANPAADYSERMEAMYEHLFSALKPCNTPVHVIPRAPIDNEADLLAFIEKFMQAKPHAEGVMIRPQRGKHSLYKFGRSWGLMRYKPWETEDLPVHSIEEGKGEHVGMAGRINVLYKGEVVGCGPGKQSHAERRELWLRWQDNPHSIRGKIAQVQYKKDPSYDAMREPTFQLWRPDKDAA